MRPLFIANWKMNPHTLQEAQQLFLAIHKGLEGVKDVDVVICPPFPFIPQILNTKYQIQVGAQDCFWEQEGAYTGEVSPLMLKNLGCSHVLLGHSERRKLGETSEMIAKKVQAVLDVFLIPVVCIGEGIEKEMEVILKNIKEADILKIVFVYEPEGAISTEPHAKPASLEQLDHAVRAMRAFLSKSATILYGGSVNSKNIQGFMEKGIQGALVGAASLDAQEFVQLAKNAVFR